MKQLSWPSEYGLDIHDVETVISWSNRSFTGRGSAASLELAIEKSCAEAFERLFCYYNGIPSSGVAAHPQLRTATENAIKEVFERSCFDLVMSGKNYAKEIDNAQISELKYVLPVGTTSSHLLLGNSGSLYSCASIFNFEQQLFLGLSSENSIPLSIEKANIECLRNLSAFKHNPEDFRLQCQQNSDLWCCDNNLINKLLVSVADSVSENKMVHKFTSRVLKKPSDSIFADIPLSVVQAVG